MKFPRLLPALFLLLLPGAVFALDISAVGGTGNLSFDTKSDAPIDNGDFTGKFYPLWRLGVTDTLSEMIGYSVSLERDPVLRNRLNCSLEIDTGYLSFSLGPLFGIGNTRQSLFRPGISAGVRADFPNIVFIVLDGGMSFGSITREGDYTMENAGAALGFWLPNIVNTLRVDIKRFSARQSDTLDTEDELFRLCYRMEVHAKGVPYTVAVDLGYQTLSRSYRDGGSDKSDQFRAVFLGFEAGITVKPLLTILFGAEMPVYAWGKQPLVRSDSAWFFQAFAGFKWTLEKEAVP